MRDRARVSMPYGWPIKHGYSERIRSFQRRNGWAAKVPAFLVTGNRRWDYTVRRVLMACTNRRLAMKKEGWPVYRQQTWWEADHIVPVVEGGGQCGPENYRTLCVRCHQKVTAELRKRISERRRNEKGNATTQEATAFDQREDQEVASKRLGTDGHDRGC